MHKFLHLSDIQLDSHFLCRSEAVRKRLRQAHRDSFMRAVDLAIEEKVLAVFLAGDVFEAGQLSFDTERFLIEQCRRLEEAQIPCIYVTGDRDAPGGATHAGPIAWPENVIFVYKGKTKIVELQDVDGSSIVRVACVGHGDGTTAIASAFPAAKESIPYFGVVHATVTTGGDGDGQVRPVPARNLKRTKYAYWALGQMKDRQEPKGLPGAWYPGFFFGRDFSEGGPRGGILVTLRENGRVDTEFKALARAQWETLILDDLAPVYEEGQLAAQVSRQFESIRNSHLHVQHWMLRLCLKGITPMAARLKDPVHRAAIETRLVEQLRVEEVRIEADEVSSPLEAASFKDEPHVLSELLALIEQAGDEAELLDEALAEPLAMSFSSPEEKRAYLTGLVQNLEQEAVLRLLQEEPHAH